MIVAGLDPGVGNRSCTGYALIRLEGVRRAVVGYGCVDGNGLPRTLLTSRVVAIDSPFSVPVGSALRRVDRTALERGFKILPPSWSSMRRLVYKSVGLILSLRPGTTVLETHPRSALKSSRCGGVEELLARAGVQAPRGCLELIESNKDVRDAVIAAVVALFFTTGVYEVVYANDGAIFLAPRLCRG